MLASQEASPAPRCRFDQARDDGYERRRPETTDLYKVVAEHWPAFRARAEEQGGLPRFVEKEFEEYLACGILENGLARLKCGLCGHEMVTGYSCKRRGFCPSCIGRRMSDVAAHLVDEVLPEVPMRHWICSLPWSLRCPVGFDRRLCADITAAFTGALGRSLRRRAKKAHGLRSVKQAITGAVTFIQRGDSALRLNVHLHTLALDGVYVRDEEGELRFHLLPPPSWEEVEQVAAWTYEKIRRALVYHGRSLEGLDELPDALASEHPVLASCYGASAGDVQLLGDSPGERVDRLAWPVHPSPVLSDALAEVGGVNVHAKVSVDGRDRKRVERLCRYLARPPLSQERLSVQPDGRVRYDFKSMWRDGTRAVLLHPLDFLARLAALVPPPRFHMIRYQGCLAARSKVRAEVVPGGSRSTKEPVQLTLFSEDGEELESARPAKRPRSSRHPWAYLLRRVFSAERGDLCSMRRAHEARRDRQRQGRHRPSACRPRSWAGPSSSGGSSAGPVGSRSCLNESTARCSGAVVQEGPRRYPSAWSCGDCPPPRPERLAMAPQTAPSASGRRIWPRQSAEMRRSEGGWVMLW